MSLVRKESIFSQRIIADDQPRFSRSAAKFASLSASRDFRRVKVSELLYWLAANKILKRPRYGPERDRKGRLVMHYDENRILDEADGIIRRIRQGELDPADSANRMVDYMRESRLANNTILMARHTILRFLRYSRLGLDYYDLNLAVKKVPRVWENLKRTPTREEVRSILLACDLRMKTLFSILISTGARMGEILMARKDRIDWLKTPVQLHLKANKVYRNRVVFLSSESVMLLKEYLKRRKNNRHQYIFSGYRNRVNTPLDRPISRNCAWEYFRRVLAKLGMTQKYDRFHYFYRPSGFRVMNLDILKSNGFPPDWAEYLVGHSISFQASYLPSTSSLSKAWLKLDSQFCFLSPSIPKALHKKDDLTPYNGSKPDPQRPIEEVEVPSEDTGFSTTHWRTKNFDYVKTNIHSEGYDQAIADGFSIFDSSPSGVRVFRKRFRGGKQWMKSVNRTLTHKHTDFKDHAKPI